MIFLFSKYGEESIDPRYLVIAPYPVRALSATPPRGTMTFALVPLSSLISSLSLSCREIPTSCSLDKSFCGGLSLTTLVIYISLLFNPTSRRVLVSNCPLPPQKGTPVSLSSFPGASPTIAISASFGPLGFTLLPIFLSSARIG